MPVFVGALEEPPGALAWLGLAVAAAGVLIVATTRSADDEIRRRPASAPARAAPINKADGRRDCRP